MRTKALFPCGGGSNLILGTGIQNWMFFSKNSSRYQLFSSNSQKLLLWCKKKSLPIHMDLYDPYIVPCTIPQGYYNFPRSTNKIQFFDKISTSGRICQLNEGLKIWTPKHKYNTKFWGGGGGVGYYNFPRSTNKIKSFDEISTSEKNYIVLHFSVVEEGQT